MKGGVRLTVSARIPIRAGAAPQDNSLPAAMRLLKKVNSE
jgi:hypothetical protein